MRRCIEILEIRAALSHAIADHIHAELTIKINNEEVFIPTNIGLVNGHYNPHTHSDDGTLDSKGVLHIGEGGPAGLSGHLRYVKLEDFFDVWREVGSATNGRNVDAFFSETSIMGYDVDKQHQLEFYVNGSPSTEFQNYIPHDGDEILISYGRIEWSWQNESMPNDVSGDGQVAPRDALLVINELSTKGAYEVDQSSKPEFYFDVSGDGAVSGIDALRVINDLN